MTYLSIAPEGLREAFITGGLSPIGRPVDDVYGATYRPADRQEPALLRALPRRPRAGPRHPAPARRRGRPAAVRRPPDRRGASASSGCGSATAPGSSTSTTSSSCRSARGRSCTTPRLASGSAGTRSTPRSTSRRTPTASPRAGRPSGCCPTRSPTERVLHRRARLPVDVGGLRGPPRRTARAAEHPRGAPVAAPVRRRPAARATRSRSRRRSTSTTCTSSATSPRRRRRPIRGLRTWNTDEFEHNGLRADGERVLGRLIDLVRGRA